MTQRPLSQRLLVLVAFALGGGCKECPPPQTTCKPDEENFEVINVFVQPGEQLNPNDDGTPLSVQLFVYQLAGDETLEMIDFETVWKEGGEVAFGDDYLSHEEVTIYPDRPDHIELKPEADVRFIVAAAIFTEPLGQDWFRVWEVPKYHGHSVCNAKKKKKPWPDPCFHVTLERYRIDGGHTPPSGWDETKMGDISCPGAPMKTPPAEVKEEPKKKKKKKKLKDAKAPEKPID